MGDIEILCKLVAYFVRDIWLDDRSTGMYWSERSTLITWWQVHRNVCSERSALIMWWQVHRNFSPKGPPSSCDDRSTGIFRKVHSHHVMTGPLDQKCPPSSRDDRYTGIFSFQKLHPHHVMTGPPEFLLHKVRPHHMMTGPPEFAFQKVHHHVVTGPPEIFVPKGPPL